MYGESLRTLAVARDCVVETCSISTNWKSRAFHPDEVADVALANRNQIISTIQAEDCNTRSASRDKESAARTDPAAKSHLSVGPSRHRPTRPPSYPLVNTASIAVMEAQLFAI